MKIAFRVKNNNSRLMYYLTGSKTGKQQLKILGFNLTYCLMYGVIHLLLSTRYLII